MKMELLPRCASTSRCAARSARPPASLIESGGDRHPQALARGGDAARGRGERPLPAGRVRRRPLAGAPGRGHRRVPEPGRVLPPHLPDREPEAAAGRRACSASSGKGGDPVVQLQTNFGGGKTHSMLALYHLFSGIAPSELAGIDAVLTEAGVDDAAHGAARGAGRQQDLARQPGHQARRHGGAHAVGRAGLAARRQEGLRPRRRPTTRRPPAPATCCASCSTSTAPA